MASGSAPAPLNFNCGKAHFITRKLSYERAQMAFDILQKQAASHAIDKLVAIPTASHAAG
jgi:hypothetical protein